MAYREQPGLRGRRLCRSIETLKSSQRLGATHLTRLLASTLMIGTYLMNDYLVVKVQEGRTLFYLLPNSEGVITIKFPKFLEVFS